MLSLTAAEQNWRRFLDAEASAKYMTTRLGLLLGAVAAAVAVAALPYASGQSSGPSSSSILSPGLSQDEVRVV